jgi:tetratricopeptide (TPR) repeat protein
MISLAVLAIALTAAPDLSQMDPSVAHPLAQATETALTTDRGADWAVLGQRLLAHELVAAASEAFAHAERADPQDFRWAHLSGYAAVLAGDDRAAIAAYRRALDLDRTQLATALRLARLLEDDEPAAAETLYRSSLPSAAASSGLGRIALTAGDTREAISRFTDALDRDPDANRIHYQLAMALRAASELDAARAEIALAGPVPVRIDDPLVDAVAVYSKNPQTYIDLAAYAMRYGNAEGALRALDDALLVDSSLAEAWVLRTEALIALQRDQEARTALSRLMSTDAGGIGAVLTRAPFVLALHGRDRMLATITSLDRAALSDDQKRRVAALRLAAGDALTAAAEFGALADEAGADGLVDRYHQGLALSAAQNCLGAAATFELALEIAPGEGALMDAAARTWATCDGIDPDRRRRALEFAVALVRARPGAAYAATLAMAAAANGDFRRAVRVQRQLLDMARQANDSALPSISANLQRFQQGQRAITAWVAGDPVFDLVD